MEKSIIIKTMPHVITVKIDVTLIDKAKLFKGSKCNKKNILPQYLDLVLLPTKQSNFGDWRDEQTHMVCQSVSKEERDKGVKGEILGNACEKKPRSNNQQSEPAAPSQSPEEPESDDVPF